MALVSITIHYWGLSTRPPNVSETTPCLPPPVPGRGGGPGQPPLPPPHLCSLALPHGARATWQESKKQTLTYFLFFKTFWRPPSPSPTVPGLRWPSHVTRYSCLHARDPAHRPLGMPRRGSRLTALVLGHLSLVTARVSPRSSPSVNAGSGAPPCVAAASTGGRIHPPPSYLSVLFPSRPQRQGIVLRTHPLSRSSPVFPDDNASSARAGRVSALRCRPLNRPLLRAGSSARALRK